MNEATIMIVQKTRLIILLFLATLLIATTIGSGGDSSVRGGTAVFYDMHHRNPWYGHPGAIPPPHYIGPPPVILPPDIPDMPPLEAVPLPM